MTNLPAHLFNLLQNVLELLKKTIRTYLDDPKMMMMKNIFSLTPKTKQIPNLKTKRMKPKFVPMIS
jgi:hypothetical protein